MKGTQLLRRVLAVVLTLTLLASFVTPVLAEIVPQNTGKNSVRDSSNIINKLIDIDPASLNVKKLSALFDSEDAEVTVDLPYELTDTVRVSIFLEEPSALEKGYAAEGIAANKAAIAYRNKLKQAQSDLTAEIEETLGKKIDIAWNFTLAANAISVNVTLKDALLIAAMDGVASVELENRYNVPAPIETDDPYTVGTAEYMTGAAQVWNLGYTGAGGRVAIIDTGIAYSHQSFDGDALEYSLQELGFDLDELLDEDELESVIESLNAYQKGAAADNSYISSKIPFAYNYVDENTDITHDNDNQTEHGSHVAGIAAANKYIKVVDNASGDVSYEYAPDYAHAIGMAPDAQLIVMKVFGTNGGANDSDYFAAVEDAIVLGCDAANLSLGSAANGFTYTNEYQYLLNALADGEYNADLVLAVSAGNDGSFADDLDFPYLYSEDVSMHRGGQPGTLINSLGVASADSISVTSPAIFFGDLTVVYSETAAYGNDPISTIAGEHDFVYIDAIGTEEQFAAVADILDGKVAICNRGETSFYEKANAAVANGAIAVIVANNTSGTILMNLTGYEYTAPAVTILQADAEAIKAQSDYRQVSLGGEPEVMLDVYTGSLEVSENVGTYQTAYRLEAAMSSFSSWGVPGSLLMKPEITAPGGSIYSVDGTSNRVTDAYEVMSGTSMAAPHITGLAALLAQYLRENEISIPGYSLRAVVQSLIMSTATPMYDWTYGAPYYYSILQQGAGLVDIEAALSAASVIMMGQGDNTLTALTGAAADGKVKVELGDDPDRTGVYTYTFTVYNLRDYDLEYELYTDMFVQYYDYIRYYNEETEELYDQWYMMPDTDYLYDAEVTYTWLPDRDINKDGVTDELDAQAILDYITGLVDGEDLALDRADLDGDGDITSYDAYLLLNWSPEDGILVVPANGSKEVTVVITLDEEEMAYYDQVAPNGTYIQGYTYVYGGAENEDGSTLYYDEHSIPILGFYGNWTDPSMFDTTSLLDFWYGDGIKENYSGNDVTNYMTISYGGEVYPFTGNPYWIEDEIPTDKFALNSESVIESVYYNLIRSAGVTGFAISAVDEPGGDITEVLGAAIEGYNVDGLYYYENTSNPQWYNYKTVRYRADAALGEFGLEEGDTIRAGFYAIPEYYAMLLHADSITEPGSGNLTANEFAQLLEENVLGKGAYVGYDFTIDNTAPVIENAYYDEDSNTIIIDVSDNLNIAYVAVMDINGDEYYYGVAPGTDSAQIVIDGDDLDYIMENAISYVAVFAADYAGNETAVAAKVNDNGETSGQVFRLTDTVVPGGKYIFTDEWFGDVALLGQSDGEVVSGESTVKEGTSCTLGLPYIDAADIDEQYVWENISRNEEYAVFANGTYYLAIIVTTDEATGAEVRQLIVSEREITSWVASSGYIYDYDDDFNMFFISYEEGEWTIHTSNLLDFDFVTTYAFELVDAPTDIDPYTPCSISVENNYYYLCQGDTDTIVAALHPATAADSSLTYESSDTSIVTVDEKGVITGVAPGEATITVSSAANPEVFTECYVKVITIDRTLNAIVWDEDGYVHFSEVNMGDPENWIALDGDEGSDYALADTMIIDGELYAVTCNPYSGESELYRIDPETFEATYIDYFYYWTTAVAPGPSDYADYGIFVQSYGPYFMTTDYEPSLGCWDYISLSWYGGGKIAGITLYEDCGSWASYLVLDTYGDIWYIEVDGVSIVYLDFIGSTGISTELTYQGLYYDGEYLYWSHWDGDYSTLYAIDVSVDFYEVDGDWYAYADTFIVYEVGDFGYGVWPVSGFYDPALLGDFASEPEVGNSITVPKQTNPAPAAKMAVLPTEIAVESVIYPERTPLLNFTTVTETDDEEFTATLTITEEVDVTNGYITVEYDTDKLTFVSATSDATISSVNADEDDGIIFIAFADLEGIEADNAVVTVVFECADCLDSDVLVTALEINDDFDGFEEELTVTGTKHDWAEPEWGWVTDEEGVYTAAIAEFVCSNDEDHVEYVRATAEVETHDPSCTENGSATYTVTVTGPDGEEYSDTKTVVLYPQGHIYGVPTYVWADDYSTCTGSMTCTVCNYVFTETVEAAAATVEATCDTDGSITYTATFECPSFEEQTKVVVLNATDHTYGVPTYVWADDYSTCTAAVVCIEEDDTITETVETSSATVEATCEEDGSVTYTAEFENELFETQTAVVTIETDGHNYEFAGIEWADDYKSAEFVFVCAENETHVVRIAAVVTVNEVDGQLVYTATAEGPDGATVTENSPAIPKTGDSFDAAVYTVIAVLAVGSAVTVISVRRKKIADR